MRFHRKEPPTIQNIPVSATPSGDPGGRHILLDGEDFYCIESPDQMPEFFMSMISSGDHWMFVSSRGALTAGRRDPNGAIFPYYSADKLSDLRGSTGPCTIIRINRFGGPSILWEPFTGNISAQGNRRQQLYKNATGNKLWLEETNDSLGLLFRYQWTFGNRFGFVRTSQICNLGAEPLAIEILDGVRNILPACIDQNFQLRFSNLADAYKKSERWPESPISLYYLNSVPTDLAEPSEGLRSTIVWQLGMNDPSIVLSNRQLDQFRIEGRVDNEYDLRGQRGCWFGMQKFILQPAEPDGEPNRESMRSWSIVIDTGYDQADVIDLEQSLRKPADLLYRELQEDIADCQSGLYRIAASSDGIQHGADRLRNERHLSNTLFNLMRGGIPAYGMEIKVDSFIDHLRRIAPVVFGQHSRFLGSLPPVLPRTEFLDKVSSQNDPDLLRLSVEYLPFFFSRRHGDPTRPWNAFSIDIRNPDGSRKLNYEGNWRDIFQNWEALALSFPGWAPAMIMRFVNASTIDGYNPYRINSSGFDWEKPDEHDAWSNIGYWGDHQIIYLLKLVELSRSFVPEGLDDFLNQDVCVYANVPYRIRNYEDIRKDPRGTVEYDYQLDIEIGNRLDTEGNEARLLRTSAGNLLRASLAEKLLVPALAKLTNFVPDGGIWLTTQRPEWNDANNALAGYGLSVVTTCYLRRYCDYMASWFDRLPDSGFAITSEVAMLLEQVGETLQSGMDLVSGPLTTVERRRIVDALGTAGSRFRRALYEQGPAGNRREILSSAIRDFFRIAGTFLDLTIRNNKRLDGLFHSYNLLSYEIEGRDDRIKHLGEMLEGQVAALSSGLLSPEESVELLDSLRNSDLFRADQNSYMLGPDKVLPRFVDKNMISDSLLKRSRLLQKLVADNNHSIVKQDVLGGTHFNGDFRNADDLNAAIDQIATNERYRMDVAEDRKLVLDIFEDVFRHSEFTGRSGSFFGYEGLGSIYWHMVSKLLLAVQENLIRFRAEGIPHRLTDRLFRHYREIREGLGLNKSPQEYGAFPTDPYSHTPMHAGAQQPGMTGQVKEDILVRMMEIGIRIADGCLGFDTSLFDVAELTGEETRITYLNVAGTLIVLNLPPNSFAFTFCQTPVIYTLSDSPGLCLHWSDGSTNHRSSMTLDRNESAKVFDRSGCLSKIEVRITRQSDSHP